MLPQRSGGALADLSSQLASAVETAAKSVVAIHARQRIPSSGILWRDGVIVSASHTVRRDGQLSVTLPNGDAATATVTGRDAATDIVALRLSDGTSAATEPRSDGETDRAGSLVLAVGRAGRNVSASFGIISLVREGWRTAGGARLERALRLDLAVYDGFSGGALVDASGRVIGMNNSALARGTPVALPSTTVNHVLEELLQRGHVRRPFIGVAIHPVSLSAALVARHQLPRETALVVVGVADGAPADDAGLLLGDVLIDAGGDALGSPSDLLDAISGVREGASVALKLLRGGGVRTISVKPIDREAAGSAA